MAIPFRYNFRNLFRRKLRTCFTLFGIAMAVAAAVIMMAYSRGLLLSVRENGDPDNVVIISKKAVDRTMSSLKRGSLDVLESLVYDTAAVRVVDGEAVSLVAPYVHHTALVEVGSAGASRYGGRKLGIIMGVDAQKAPQMINAYRLAEGRNLAPGDERVAVVGSLAHARLGVERDDLRAGTKLSFNGVDWEIVGRFAAPGSTAETEIWVPEDELTTVLNRTDFSFAVVKLENAAAVPEVVQKIVADEQVEFKAISEVEFFKGLAETFVTFAIIGLIMAGIVTFGGVMAGLNTMYTAVHGRTRELGTLRILGFSRGSILTSILVESGMLAVAGGVLGCCIGYLVNGMPMRVTMGVFEFRVDGLVLGAAMGLAVVIGLTGALLPGLRAVRMGMVDAMRYS